MALIQGMLKTSGLSFSISKYLSTECRSSSNKLRYICQPQRCHHHISNLWIPASWNFRAATTAAASNDSTLDNLQEKWDIYASICLERKPLLTKEKTSLEKKYTAFLTEYELESSHKSDHEIRNQNDATLLEKIKTGEVDQGSFQTAQDFEDKSTAELLTFVPMSRKTDADELNDTKSLNRALDSHLVFVVEQKLGKNYEWICPQLKVHSAETLRRTAERILEEICPNVQAKVMGNAPFGFYKYRYPSGTKNESGDEMTGAKVFFYKANYFKGKTEVSNSKIIPVNDFLWLTRTELKSKLKDKYHRTLSKLLVPEDIISMDK